MASENDVNPCPERCPLCGSERIWSYGLAGGGIGYYEMCARDGCQFFMKHRENTRREPANGK